MPALPSPAVLDDAVTATCPAWCSGEHAAPVLDPNDGGALVEHRGPVIEAGGQTIVLWRTVWLDADGRLDVEPTKVLINDSMAEAPTVDEVRAFAAGLVELCGTADTAAVGGEGVIR